MIDRVLDLYAGVVDAAAVVVHPSAEQAVRRHLAGTSVPVHVFLQDRPDGMLPAIRIPAPLAERLRAEQVWVTWCDQVGIHPLTVERLSAVMQENGPAMAFPTCPGPRPYIHFERDRDERIIRVLQRREGDVLPSPGESDAGLFALCADAYLDELKTFAEGAGKGHETGEANFLPFIPWLAARRTVVTFPVHDRVEALGVNTPEDRETMEAYLRERS